MNPHPILIISGTNRRNSSAARLSRVLESHYQRLRVPAEIYDLADLPLEIFDPTAYDQKPDAFSAIQQKVLDAPGLHVITPEYNGSFPGVLKYFVDMLQFPESFEAKPVAFVGESSGAWGALRAVEQLQLVFAYRNAHVYPVRVFIPSVHKQFDATGALAPGELNDRLFGQAKGFADYIRCVGSSAPRAR